MSGLSQNDIQKVVNTFLDKLAADPIFGSLIKENRQALMETMTTVLMKQKPDLNAKDLLDKNFIKQLSMAFVTTLTLHKLSLDSSKNFFDRVKNIFNGKEDLLKKLMDPKLDPKELEKLLTAEDKRKLQEEIKKCCAEMLHDLNRLGLTKPKPPEPGKPKLKADEEMSKNFEAYSNLFSILSSAVTGSHPIVVFCMIGNGLGFTDWNPNHGSAQIDTQNATNNANNVEGNDITMSNYLQFAGDDFVDEFIKELQSEVPALNTAPKPKGPGALPSTSAY
ncbi:MAG: hypothetical protein JO149_01260 [Gammaproteobacteria bacterium]|nr:hypothetical protein [Gammaproteobacteria bacterium]